MKRKVVLFGASGRLGQSLNSKLAKLQIPVTVVPSHIAKNLNVTKDETAIEEWVSHILGGGKTDLVFANGNTNLQKSREKLFRDNFEFPLRVIKASMHISSVRYLTFGSALENFENFAKFNPYVEGKKKLAERIENYFKTELSGQICHLRLHTLYGGVSPSPHMFLGQMLSALRANRPFLMSEGRQLREYHHIDDVTEAIVHLLHQKRFSIPIVTLSSGNPVRLVDLAKAVFTSLNQLSNLEIGKLETGKNENFDMSFDRSKCWLLTSSRNPIKGVCTWMGKMLDS